MIQLRNFSIGYGKTALISDVSTEFPSGRLTALIGRNGSGKSTLLRAMAGIGGRYSGNVIVDGHSLDGMNPRTLARTLAFVNTQRTRIPDMRCADVVAMGRAPYTDWIGRLLPADREIVDRALTSVGMAAYARRTLDTMSDGECQRIMIARALAQTTPVILLDEPTSFLDMPNRYELVMLLRKLVREQNKCIVFSTHELDVALRLCDYIALVAEGTLYNLPVEEMKEAGHIRRLFGIPGCLSDNLEI